MLHSGWRPWRDTGLGCRRWIFRRSLQNSQRRQVYRILYYCKFKSSKHTLTKLLERSRHKNQRACLSLRLKMQRRMVSYHLYLPLVDILIQALTSFQLSREDEAGIGKEDLEVRREDQDKINSFSRLHQREILLEEDLKSKAVPASSLVFHTNSEIMFFVERKRRFGRAVKWVRARRWRWETAVCLTWPCCL